MENIHAVIASLALRRPVFHSEADFQHALAWELHQFDPTASVRLEKRVSTLGSRVHLDLLFQSGSGELAIELKYKTRAIELDHAGEKFNLLNQSAQDIGRHDFIKDIGRLEDYVHANSAAVGYAIFLTNDRTYWSKTQKKDSIDSEFRLHEGRQIQGSVTWGERAAAGTMYRREEPIVLRGRYETAWRDFSSLGNGRGEQFRYLAIRVPSAGQQRR